MKAGRVTRMHCPPIFWGVILLLLLAGCGAPVALDGEGEAPATLGERRLVSVDAPQWIWVGEVDHVRLALEVDEEGRIATALGDESRSLALEAPEAPGLYDAYHLVAEARLDLPSMDVRPQGGISEAMQPGRPVRFSWSLSPARAGVYRGTLWVYLNLAPKGGGEVERQALLALPVEIRGRSAIFGLPVRALRWAGAAGVAFGLVAGFPLLQNILAFFWKRLQDKLDKYS